MYLDASENRDTQFMATAAFAAFAALLSKILSLPSDSTTLTCQAVGEMNRSSKFSKAVSQLVQKGLPPPPPQQKQTPRPHLHFIAAWHPDMAQRPRFPFELFPL
jgi:hypothetical protein